MKSFGRKKKKKRYRNEYNLKKITIGIVKITISILLFKFRFVIHYNIVFLMLSIIYDS